MLLWYIQIFATEKVVFSGKVNLDENWLEVLGVIT